MILNAVVLQSLKEPTDNHFDPNWPQQYPGIGRSSKGKLAIQLTFGYNIAIS